ncbi:MAG: cupin domain-containing protein [Actinomycetota bacterium]|nr:cupin domain-containing protein [Actinomycetota bacterium]
MGRLISLSLCAAIAAMVPSAAWAGPVQGVSGTVLAKGVSAGTITAENQGISDVVVRHIVIEPGGSTGWHYHSGELIAVVHAGTLTRQLDDCSAETNTAGQSFVEPAGRDHTHIGRNLGAEAVELYVTYLIPAGDPLAVDAPDPGC